MRICIKLLMDELDAFDFLIDRSSDPTFERQQGVELVALCSTKRKSDNHLEATVSCSWHWFKEQGWCNITDNCMQLATHGKLKFIFRRPGTKSCSQSMFLFLPEMLAVDPGVWLDGGGDVLWCKPRTSNSNHSFPFNAVPTLTLCRCNLCKPLEITQKEAVGFF